MRGFAFGAIATFTPRSAATASPAARPARRRASPGRGRRRARRRAAGRRRRSPRAPRGAAATRRRRAIAGRRVHARVEAAGQIAFRRMQRQVVDTQPALDRQRLDRDASLPVDRAAARRGRARRPGRPPEGAQLQLGGGRRHRPARARSASRAARSRPAAPARGAPLAAGASSRHCTWPPSTDICARLACHDAGRRAPARRRTPARASSAATLMLPSRARSTRELRLASATRPIDALRAVRSSCASATSSRFQASGSPRPVSLAAARLPAHRRCATPSTLACLTFTASAARLGRPVERGVERRAAFDARLEQRRGRGRTRRGRRRRHAPRRWPRLVGRALQLEPGGVPAGGAQAAPSAPAAPAVSRARRSDRCATRWLRGSSAAAGCVRRVVPLHTRPRRARSDCMLDLPGRRPRGRPCTARPRPGASRITLKRPLASRASATSSPSKRTVPSATLRSSGCTSASPTCSVFHPRQRGAGTVGQRDVRTLTLPRSDSAGPASSRSAKCTVRSAAHGRAGGRPAGRCGR